MGGTCAVDLTVMHPDEFSTFEDIAGDHGPTAGTRQQTIDRLYAGDAAQWAAFDPATVMHNHGPYTGVSGWFEDTAKPTAAQANPQAHPSRPQSTSPVGFGGHDDWRDADEEHAAEDLCAVATGVNIACTVHTLRQLPHLAVRGPGVHRRAAVAGGATSHPARGGGPHRMTPAGGVHRGMTQTNRE